MTAVEAPVTDAPAEGPPPIFDTNMLRQRIARLTPDRAKDLGEAWQWNGWGPLTGLLTAEEYHKLEAVVANYEATASSEDTARRLQELATALYALPDDIRTNAQEALKVYAGVADPSRILLTSVGRVAEIERIITEALAYEYARQQEVPAPSVADLPPVDDSAEQVASDEYPGTKADAKTVLAWVGDDRNRAARAFAHEQDRATPRKGVTAKLTDILGPDGLAQVQEAMAKATPPPMDLSAAPPAAAETGVAGPIPPVEPSEDPARPSSDAAPATPNLEVEDAVVAALRQIGAGFTALAEAVGS